jgi:hypothetical protein
MSPVTPPGRRRALVLASAVLIPAALVALAALVPAAAPSAVAQSPLPDPASPQPGDEETGPPAVAPPDGELPASAGMAEALEISPRNANYEIRVRLDPETKTLDGWQRLTWTNIREVPTAELTFHLYWNAWRNSESTWLKERRWGGRFTPRSPDRDAWGWERPESVRLVSHSGAGGPGVAGADLTARAYYDSPDDGNPLDRTVLVVPLPAPVAPGDTVQVEMEWKSKIPRTFARTGFRGDYYFIAHWFPKLGVFEGPAGWTTPQFHSNTEFFSDYGSYDVEITLPSEMVVGATGLLKDESDGGDGTKTLRFVQDDVHGFAWTASPDYQVAQRRFEEDGLPPVEVTLLYQPEHAAQVDRHFAAAFAALKYYGTWYGPYPYGHLTFVDPAWGSRTGGMEYPTLFTCGTRIFNPFGGGSPEGVTIHEAGHQFWYGLVGDNEFEDAWIDEGLNTFSTARTYREAYGERELEVRYLEPPGVRWDGFFARLVPSITFSRAVFGNRLQRYRPDARSDIPATPTWRYFPGTASNITYAKTALWLHTLERHLGWDVLQEILSTFFHRYRFRHPEPEDFFAIANRVAEERTGERLDWFFDQVYRDNAVFDYGVTEVRSRPVRLEGWVEEEGEGEGERKAGIDGGPGIGAELVYRSGKGRDAKENGGPVFRSEVLVQRLQDGVFPVDVLLVFEDGTEIRRHWNGRGTWKLFTHEGPSKLSYAVVDPERVLLLDVDITNNSRRLEPASALGATKWASKWMIWLQDLLQTFTFFV